MPDEMDWGQCKEAVARFVPMMELRLHKNRHKGHWRGCTWRWLLSRLREETLELEEALEKLDNTLPGNPHETFTKEGTAQNKVWAEAADVANFALMITDVATHRDAREEEEPNA